MRLNSIKLAGFKSFIDPTHMAFKSNLTAIVGPNGCGKSNIVDAIYCVLGSNSRSLRAEQMSDVIFNGTNTRKPVAQASIELIFDNIDGGIGGEYAKYPEISIRRELNRDGQSNYYLNGVRCRRRDITDLFLGTGLGSNSYAIIEQGMISRLIEAKPEELRAHVEEAAGTSKYKERRRETENRIKHTRENLDRLNDLREEQSKQLSHLQKQANAAEKYKILKTEQRLVRAQLQAILWQGLNDQIAIFDQKVNSQETALEAKVAQLRQVDKEIESKRLMRSEQSDSLNEIQSEYYSLGAEITKIEQNINHAKERKKQLENDQQQLEHSHQDLKQQHFEDKNRLQKINTEIADVELQYAESEGKMQIYSQELKDAEQKMHSWQEKWDEFNRICANSSKQMEVEKTKILHLEQKQQALLSRISRIEEEQHFQENETQLEEIIILKNQQVECQLTLEALQEQLDSIQEKIQADKKRYHEAQEEVTKLTKGLRDLQAKNASMQALQQIALGKSDTGITRWLKKHDLNCHQRLAEGLDVEAGWEIAVETVLTNHIDAICVESFDQLTHALSDLNDADIAFFNLKNEVKAPGKSKDIVSLKDKVNSSWPVSNLLQHIYIVENLIEALESLSHIEDYESIITRDGVWLSSNWLRVSRTKSEKTGVLQREHDLRELGQTIVEQQARLSKQDAFCHEIQEQLNLCTEEKEAALHQLQDMKARNSDLLAQIRAKEGYVYQLQQKNIRLTEELFENKEQLQEVELNLELARTNLATINHLAIDEEAKRQELITERDAFRAHLNEVRQQANACKQKADESQVRLESMRGQLVYLSQNLARADRQLEAIMERRQHIEEALSQITDPLPLLDSELQKTLERRAIIQDVLLQARQALDSVESNLNHLEKNRQQIEQGCQEIRTALEQIRLECQTLKVRLATCEEQIVEAGFLLEELLQNLPQDANINVWDENLLKIENRIQRLGPINLAAIEEYAILAERKEYLDKQYDDLVEALDTLENAIRKIDKETRIRFKETFAQLNDSFKTYFSQIFGGGEANLELTSDDLLETGVMVKAQPPGKRNSTIHLLSGGEKALTAIALVFAIFSLNPAPFCVLDEVDAPLDDANVIRFCNLVKKMSEKIQFVFISHNKIAIEMGQQLAGVTMNEPGVSRLVSVDVAQAISMATA